MPSEITSPAPSDTPPSSGSETPETTGGPKAGWGAGGGDPRTLPPLVDREPTT
jgi:hypothetical protein